METEQEESPLSEEERRAIRSRLLDRGIFKLYEIGVKWMPIPLMLGHWSEFGTIRDIRVPLSLTQI